MPLHEQLFKTVTFPVIRYIINKAVHSYTSALLGKCSAQLLFLRLHFQRLDKQITSLMSEEMRYAARNVKRMHKNTRRALRRELERAESRRSMQYMRRQRNQRGGAV